jgi:hypothetical protein
MSSTSSAVASINPPLAVPFTQQDGKMSHAWQRFFNDLFRKLGGHGNSAPITVENIYGLLASLNLVPNSQLNTSNTCTVDSIDNGTTATIRAYGTGGVGTTWTRVVSSTTQGPYPSFSQAGFAYATNYYVIYNPANGTYLVSTVYSDILPDGYIWAGKVLTVNSGGGGGTSGGGGGGGGVSGCTEVGTPLYFDKTTESAEVTLEANSDWIDLRFTKHEKPLRVHPDTFVGIWVRAKSLHGGELIDVGDDGTILPLYSAKQKRKKSMKQKIKALPNRTYRAGSRKVKLHNLKMV